MKTGTTLVEVLQSVKAQAQSAKDMVVDTRALSMTGGRLQLATAGAYDVRDMAHTQISERLGIPATFYKRLREEQPDMLDYNVTQLFHRNPERRMVRTLEQEDGRWARAFLSDRYRRFDNYQLADAILPVLADLSDLRFESCQVTERRMYLKAVYPRLEAEVKPGDIVQSGIVISNSEVGSGATEVAMLLFRLVCSNGAIVEDARSRRYHVGKHVGGEDEEQVLPIFSDETLRVDDQAFRLKLRDVVRSAVSEERFLDVVARAKDAAGEKSERKPTDMVEVLGNKLALTKDESGSLLEHLCSGGDFSRWGVANAVTRLSQDMVSYDRATELERAGGSLLSASSPVWASVKN